MKRRSSYLFCTLVFSLLCTATLHAGVKIELTSGEMISVDRIQWSGPSAILLESDEEEIVSRKTIALSEIKGLSIGANYYDQKTIQLAAAHQGIVKPVEYISSHKKKRYPVTFPEYQPETSTLPPPLAVSEYRRKTDCPRGVVIGIHEDPLSAYAPLVHQYFPHGVPTLERGHVLALMRAKAAEQALNILPRPPRQNSVQPPAPIMPPPPGRAPVSGKLTNIAVQAMPMNSDGKADFNALAIRLKGFDSQGNPARLSGTVKIKLYGQRQLLLRVWDQQFAAKPIQTISLAEWTALCSTTPQKQTARVSNRFGAGEPGAQTWIVKLPPRIPEHNPNIYALGEIQVTLVAPGKGTFQASTNAVPLKHVSLNRDLSLANYGTRFFPSETTSEGISRISRLNLNAPSRPSSRPLSVQP